MAFTDVYDGSELLIEVAEEYDDTEEEWLYETIDYRRDFSPDMPENTRDVYDRLEFRGKKKIRATNELSIEQEFMGFDEGLYPLKNKNGLLVKVTIEPEDGDAPTDDTRYYTNWCTNQPEWSAPDEGEFNVTLSGTFDDEEDEEPNGTEDWVNTAS